MLYKEYIKIELISIHSVGNKVNEDGVILSLAPLVLNEECKDLLKKYFMTPFCGDEYYSFTHVTDLALNEVFLYVSGIFDDANSFHENTMRLSEFLYEKSGHPNIKSGEIYVVLFRDCILDDVTVDAVGIFKSENKDTYINVDRVDKSFVVGSSEGININKLDKGCLIFNTKREEGYVVAVVDNSNKSEAKYWVEDFLNVKPRQDKYFQTRNFMSVCKNFVSKQLPEEFEVSKADQVELLNRSVQYFKENDEFSIQEFSQSVLEQPELIESFNAYKDRYQSERDVVFEDSFEISSDAVKKQSRSFKSVIKLDKNFHIYVHGDRRMIEQGEDEKGRYYKVYYKEEF